MPPEVPSSCFFGHKVWPVEICPPTRSMSVVPTACSWAPEEGRLEVAWLVPPGAWPGLVWLGLATIFLVGFSCGCGCASCRTKWSSGSWLPLPAGAVCQGAAMAAGSTQDEMTSRTVLTQAPVVYQGWKSEPHFRPLPERSRGAWAKSSCGRLLTAAAGASWRRPEKRMAPRYGHSPSSRKGVSSQGGGLGQVCAVLS